MKTRSITEIAKSFLNEEIPKDGIICGFTMGGGHDTLISFGSGAGGEGLCLRYPASGAGTHPEAFGGGRRTPQCPADPGQP